MMKIKCPGIEGNAASTQHSNQSSEITSHTQEAEQNSTKVNQALGNTDEMKSQGKEQKGQDQDQDLPGDLYFLNCCIVFTF